MAYILFALCIVIAYLSSVVELLDNGLARRPPMGWMSWGYYMCGVDCRKNPLKCLDEKLILSVADKFYREGYLEAGYEYIIIDDCWSERQRDSNGQLVPDRERFPHGMKYIADYIHKRGLKFGMYTNIAKTTCMGYPGSRDYFEKDTKMFAEWDVDYLKVDGCFVEEDYLNTAYIKLGAYLNATGRPMVYSCSWPYYIEFIHHKQPDYATVSKYCNVWRSYHDVVTSWGAIASIITHYQREYEHLYKFHGPAFSLRENEIEYKLYPDYATVSKYCNVWRSYHDVVTSWGAIASIITHYQREYEHLYKFHGPGHWNDPDMLIFGTGSLSDSQSRVHIAVYAMLAAPLLLSCDMDRISEYEKKLLLNLDLIAIAQDPLGIMGKPYVIQNRITLWVKPHFPRKGDKYHSVSFALVNLSEGEATVSFTPGQYGLNSTDRYTVMDIFSQLFVKNITLSESLEVDIPAEDAVIYTMFPL